MSTGTKKKAQCENCKLSCIWGKMSRAWEGVCSCMRAVTSAMSNSLQPYGACQAPPSKRFSRAWETASQITLRNCSKQGDGKVGTYMIPVNGEYMQPNTYFLHKAIASQEEQTSP